MVNDIWRLVGGVVNFIFFFAERAVSFVKNYFTDDKLFRSWYYNEDGSLKKAGSIIKRVEYSKALESIANNGIEEFYNGTIAMEIVKQVNHYSYTDTYVYN